MNLQFKVIDGLNIRFAAQASGNKENVLLLTPLPESVLAFTPIWGALSEHFNLLAIDLPGMGHSDGREDLYSTENMANFLIKVIETFSFSSPHIIGPDIGTPIALFMAANFPEKIKSVIVSGGACVYPFQIGPFLKEILYAPDLSGYAAVPIEKIIDGALTELKNYKIPAEIRADYVSTYKGEHWVIEAFEMLRSYVDDIPKLDKKIEDINVPVQILWGKNDLVAPVQNAVILNARLPKNKLDIINEGMHYIWEENSSEYIGISLNWLNGGYKKFEH